MRDDKSYPYIFLSDRDQWPRLSFHRGPKKVKGTYFGPFPSVQAVRDSMGFLQKVFKVRQCEDVFFKNRSRPCLQHQIKRCTAPCVDLVSDEDYAADVEKTRLYLDGKADKIIARLNGIYDTYEDTQPGEENCVTILVDPDDSPQDVANKILKQVEELQE